MLPVTCASTAMTSDSLPLSVNTVNQRKCTRERGRESSEEMKKRSDKKRDKTEEDRRGSRGLGQIAGRSLFGLSVPGLDSSEHVPTVSTSCLGHCFDSSTRNSRLFF
ncbi:hypothetical protein K0M31_005402 [Melipona bicolor]|uniref:Uncharacterized protein n=1 Tax=Melipona bicolor TaxID=60889 RepID=A0AA40KMF5_9HYME|nr:hypothetical protein K0M31_005402 [Melipona bicolor]